MPDTAEAVAQYGSAVYRLAYAMTRSRSDADDVFQEVFPVSYTHLTLPTTNEV